MTEQEAYRLKPEVADGTPSDAVRLALQWSECLGSTRAASRAALHILVGGIDPATPQEIADKMLACAALVWWGIRIIQEVQNEHPG